MNTETFKNCICDKPTEISNFSQTVTTDKNNF